jgi:hypothetical protein
LWTESRREAWEGYLRDLRPAQVEVVVKTHCGSAECGCRLANKLSDGLYSIHRLANAMVIFVVNSVTALARPIRVNVECYAIALAVIVTAGMWW